MPGMDSAMTGLAGCGEQKAKKGGSKFVCNRKTQARFCCVECGYEANADLVAAINVRRAGLARIACEVNDGVSRQQQEPTSVAA